MNWNVELGTGEVKSPVFLFFILYVPKTYFVRTFFLIIVKLSAKIGTN